MWAGLGARWGVTVEGAFAGLWLLGALLSLLAAFDLVTKQELLYCSLLMLAASARHLCYVEREPARRLLGQFETNFLLVNVAMGVVAVGMGAFVGAVDTAWALIVLLMCLPYVFVDALALSRAVKLRAMGGTVAFYLVYLLYNAFVPNSHVDRDTELFLGITAASLYHGRLVNLGLFMAKYTVDLYCRPGICLQYKLALSRREEGHLYVDTLRGHEILP
jgi:hypothetical protein